MVASVVASASRQAVEFTDERDPAVEDVAGCVADPFAGREHPVQQVDDHRQDDHQQDDAANPQHQVLLGS
jgi:hypothetical protein